MAEEIPPGVYSYRMEPQFVSHWDRARPGPEWFVFGPAEKVMPGGVVEVIDRQATHSFVTVLDLVGERTVNKRDSTQIQFVLATFDRCVEEE